MTATNPEQLHEAVASALTKHAKLKYTKNRRLVVDVLAAMDKPVTPPEITKAGKQLAASTVYRNLDLLADVGVVRKIAGEPYSFYELAEPLKPHHHHLICVDCGDIEDVEFGSAFEAQVDKGLTKAAKKAGFKPLHHTLDLQGLCKACA